MLFDSFGNVRRGLFIIAKPFLAVFDNKVGVVLLLHAKTRDGEAVARVGHKVTALVLILVEVGIDASYCFLIFALVEITESTQIMHLLQLQALGIF